MLEKYPYTKQSINYYSNFDFVSLLNELIKNGYWSNGVSFIGINYTEQKTIFSASIGGRDLSTGEEVVELLPQKDFIEFLHKIKKIYIAENKEKESIIDKTFNNFIEKI